MVVGSLNRQGGASASHRMRQWLRLRAPPGLDPNTRTGCGPNEEARVRMKPHDRIPCMFWVTTAVGTRTRHAMVSSSRQLVGWDVAPPAKGAAIGPGMLSRCADARANYEPKTRGLRMGRHGWRGLRAVRCCSRGHALVALKNMAAPGQHRARSRNAVVPPLGHQETPSACEQDR